MSRPLCVRSLVPSRKMMMLVQILGQGILLPTDVMLNFRGIVLQFANKENQNCAV